MTVSEWKRVFVEQTAIWLLYSPVGERQSVGRRAVHILAVKHKTALVGLHALDYWRGCLFNRERRLARQLHRRLIMVLVVQRDTGIHLAFCIP